MIINRFTISIPVDAKDIHFSFHPVNIREKQLYQVYVNYENAPYRFHMQMTSPGRFAITDKSSCPKQFHELESQFSDAIMVN